MEVTVEMKLIIENILNLISHLLDEKRETVDYASYNKCLELLYNHQMILIDLTRSNNLNIRHTSMLLLEICLLECSLTKTKLLQLCARNHGLLLWHLKFTFDVSVDEESKLASLKFLSLLCMENIENLNIITRALPPMLLKYLVDDNDLYLKNALVGNTGLILTAKGCELNKDAEGNSTRKTLLYQLLFSPTTAGDMVTRYFNWKLLYITYQMDHCTPILMWNTNTRSDFIQYLHTGIYSLSLSIYIYIYIL